MNLPKDLIRLLHFTQHNLSSFKDCKNSIFFQLTSKPFLKIIEDTTVVSLISLNERNVWLGNF